MKRLLLPLLLTPLLGGCGFQPAKVATDQGTIDWSYYERWTSDPPRIVSISELDSEARAVLREKSDLIHQVLQPPSARDVTAQFDRIKGKFPAKNQRRFGKIGLVELDHYNIWESYRRQWNQLSVDNFSTALGTIEKRVQRELAALSRGENPYGVSVAQTTLAREWLTLHFQPLVQEMRTLSAPANQPSPQARWAEWERERLPLIQDSLSAMLTRAKPISEDDTFQIENRGEVLIVLTISDRPIYLMKDDPNHKLRFSDERTKTSFRLFASDDQVDL